MDYRAFYAEVADWIYASNNMAAKHGLSSNEFWRWVATSTGEMCNKYQNNPLVQQQVKMLYSWLEEFSQGG